MRIVVSHLRRADGRTDEMNYDYYDGRRKNRRELRLGTAVRRQYNELNAMIQRIIKINNSARVWNDVDKIIGENSEVHEN
jgi:hypothetical protein